MSIGSAGVVGKRTELGLKMIVGIPVRSQRFLPFVVSPIPFRLDEWQRLNEAGETKLHSQRHKQNSVQIALEWQKMLKTDQTLTLAQIARNTGISRARVTQIMSLLRLPAGILDCYRAQVPPARLLRVSARKLYGVLAIKSTAGQLAEFNRLSRKEHSQRPKSLKNMAFDGGEEATFAPESSAIRDPQRPKQKPFSEAGIE